MTVASKNHTTPEQAPVGDHKNRIFEVNIDTSWTRARKIRRRKVQRFLTRLALHVVWWDILLNRPFLRRFRSSYIIRWQALAIRYRALALEVGGVMIKLGQFLATRVDLLPVEITRELAGLQDEVPPAPFDLIRIQTEADFGRPLSAVFEWVSPEAVAAASLGQAHRARLYSGEEVVVKVLRPGISEIVESDLAIFSKFVRQLKRYEPIRRHVDLDRLVDEFVKVTRKELDLLEEGKNAERFGRDFIEDSSVYVPQIYWQYTATHTLTMEDVSYIKVTDVASIRAAGIVPEKVIGKLFDLYLAQYAVTHFVHADPHGGNLFIKPVPYPGELPRPGHPLPYFLPGERVPFHPNREFQIAFVDFGMVVTIPQHLRKFMRKYIVGIGTRDAHMIVEAYLDGGIMLPDADIERVELMTQSILDKFSGSLLGQMKDVDLEKYGHVLMEFRDLLYSSPFQFQADLLFVFRAMGVLSGLAAELAPQFEPLAKIMPFAQQLMMEDWQPSGDSPMKLLFMLLALPGRLDDILTKAQRGRLAVKTTLDDESKRALRRVNRSVTRLGWMLAGVGLFIAGVIWRVGESIGAAVSNSNRAADKTGFVVMAIAAVIFVVGLLRGRRD